MALQHSLSVGSPHCLRGGGCGRGESKETSPNNPSKAKIALSNFNDTSVLRNTIYFQISTASALRHLLCATLVLLDSTPVQH